MPPKPAAKPAAETPPPPPPPTATSCSKGGAAQAAPADRGRSRRPPTAVLDKPAEPKPETPPPPSPEPVAAAAPAPSKPVPKPHVRPPHTPTTLPTPPDLNSDFDPDKIASLLSREPPPATGLTSDDLATLGVSTGGDTAKMTENELDALRAQVQKCWVLPTGWTDPAAGFGRHPLRPQPGRHRPRHPGRRSRGRPASTARSRADNAIRAVLRCGPYRLPPEKYDQWKEVQIRFTPET